MTDMTITSRLCLALVTVLAVLLPQSAGGDENAPFAMLSFENTSCGGWAQSESQPATRQVYLYWFRGFVSGYNFGSSAYEVSLSSMPDNATLALYIDKYCRDNPLLPFTGAALSLVREQRAKLKK